MADLMMSTDPEYGAVLASGGTGGAGGAGGIAGPGGYGGVLPVAPPAPVAPPRQMLPPQQAPAPAMAEEPGDQYQDLQRQLLEQRLAQQLRGSAGTMVEPQWVPRGIQLQSREPLSEQTRYDLEAAARARAEAEVNVARAEQAATASMAAQAEQEAAAQQRQLDADRARRVEVDATVHQLLEANDKEVNEIKSAKIDTGRWWSDRSAGGKIAAVIGMVLMGAGGGDAFAALSQIQQTDIDAQKTDLESQLRGTAERRSAIAQLAQMYGTPEAAETALRERQLAIVQQRASAMGQRAASDVARERLAVFGAQVEEQLAQLRARLEEQTLATVQQSIAYDPGGYRGGRSPDLAGAVSTAQQLGELGQQEELDIKPTLINVDGQPVGVAKDQKVKDQHEAHKAVLQSTADFEEALKKWRLPGLNPVNRRQALSARQTLVHDYTQLLISRGIEGRVAIKEAEAKVPGISPVSDRMSLADVDIQGLRSESTAAIKRIEENEIIDPMTARGIGRPRVKGAKKVE